MIKAGILVPENCVSTTVVGTADLLAKANQLSGKALIDFKLIGQAKKEWVTTDSRIPIIAQESFKKVKAIDWLIIPALGSDLENIIRQNHHYVPWIKRLYLQGTAIISICTGAFLLAETGLLEGKNAVTHWFFQSKFEQDYPSVKMIDEKIIVDQENIYMCGGAGLYSNLVLYLISKFFGTSLAVDLSKFALLDMNRTATHFVVLEGQKLHHDKKILAVQNYLEQHFKETITLDFLAHRFSLSKRTLARNFKQKTGNTVVEYLQRVRVESAKKLLESTQFRVIEICLNCGYEDINYFNKIFKRYVGLPPNSYRRRFNPKFVEQNYCLSKEAAGN